MLHLPKEGLRFHERGRGDGRSQTSRRSWSHSPRTPATQEIKGLRPRDRWCQYNPSNTTLYHAPKGTSSMVSQGVQVQVHWELYTRSSGSRVVFQLRCTEQQKERQKFVLPGLSVALASHVNHAGLMAPQRRTLTTAQELPLPSPEHAQPRASLTFPNCP